MTVRFLWSSLGAAATSFTEGMGPYVVANMVWMLAAAVTTAAGTGYPPAYALGVILVPVTCGLMRMAGHAARGERVRIGQFRSGLSHRFGIHLLLGAGQLLLLFMAGINVGTGLGGESLLLAATAVVAAYVGLAIGMVASAAWPLLLDPRRAMMPVPAVLRLGIAVILKRPMGLAGLAAIEAVLVAVTAQTILLALIVPSYGALVAAHYVLPVADEISGGPAPPAVPGASDTRSR